MQNLKQEKALYKEETVIAAGLNIMLTDHITLCDLLRIDFTQELRMELVRDYLK